MAGTPGERIRFMKRPFNWGGVLVMDSASAEIPSSFDRSGLVRSPSCLGFGVRHSADVDDLSDGPFEVAVDVRWGPPDGDVSITHQIAVPSGIVTVGDAEAEEAIPVVGPCTVSVVRDDDRYATTVTIWLTPAG